MDSNKKYLPVLLILIGTVFCCISIIDLFNGLQDKQFIETVGKITYYKRVVTYGKGGKSERIDIEYEYYIDGKKYTSTKFSNGVGNIEEFEQAYKDGSNIIVYYNKHDLSESVLVTGGRYMKVDGLLIIGMLLNIWGFIGIISVKSNKANSIWKSLIG